MTERVAKELEDRQKEIQTLATKLAISEKKSNSKDLQIGLIHHRLTRAKADMESKDEKIKPLLENQEEDTSGENYLRYFKNKKFTKKNN